MPPEMTPVDSSNLTAIGFDGEAITVAFHNGAVFRYFRDDGDEDFAELFEAFSEADSKGRFFAQHIKGQYRSEKVE